MTYSIRTTQPGTNLAVDGRTTQDLVKLGEKYIDLSISSINVVGERLVHISMCPLCSQILIEIDSQLIFPIEIKRAIISEVPKHISKMYLESASVLDKSPDASGALSRRCLQCVLEEQGGCKKQNLADQIDEVASLLPSYVWNNLDVVRSIGNFAAHPNKSLHTSEIIEVEPGEAEWNLNVLDQLFDFYYAQPAKAAATKTNINTKLTAAGKKIIP